MLRLFRFALAALLLSLPAAAQMPAPRTATPALWVVRDSDTTIYLFGSFHLLPKELDWFKGPVREDFARADELVLEIPDPDPDPVGTQALAQQLATDPAGKPLTDRLGPELAAEVHAAADAAGLPPEGLDSARPWFIALTLTLVQFSRSGLERDSGVEATLSSAAHAAGKPVRGIETVPDQLRLLASMGGANETDFLRASIADLKSADANLPKLVDLWSKGRVDEFAALAFEEDSRFPDLKRTLIDDRNRRFADYVARRLEQPGVAFIAVGAGHFAGPGGVPALLAAKGMRVERVQ